MSEEEDEIAEIEAPHPKKGKLTKFIEKDVALSLFARQQKHFLDIIERDRQEDNKRSDDRAKSLQRTIIATQGSMMLLLIMAFGILALMINGKTSATLPSGASIEIGPGN